MEGWKLTVIRGVGREKVRVNLVILWVGKVGVEGDGRRRRDWGQEVVSWGLGKGFWVEGIERQTGHEI